MGIDREPDMEVIDTTNIDAPHYSIELGKLSWLPAIETEHIIPTFAAIAGRKFAKPRKRTTSVKAENEATRLCSFLTVKRFMLCWHLEMEERRHFKREHVLVEYIFHFSLCAVDMILVCVMS